MGSPYNWYGGTVTWLYDVVFTAGTSLTQGVITVTTTFTVSGDAVFTGTIDASGVTSAIFYDNTLKIKDNTTPTKIMQFQLSGLSAGTTTITVPDGNDTMATIAGTQTFTNKTHTSPKINENVALTSTSTVLNLLSAAGGSTGTNTTNIVFSTSPSLTTPAIGVATGTSLAVTGLLKSSSATAGVGYATGAQGTAVSQGVSKSTSVASTGMCGEITMNAAALVKFDPATGAGVVTFTVTNTSVGLNDSIIVNHISAGTNAAYLVSANGLVAATSFNITVINVSGGTLSEAIVLQYTIIKSVRV